jgi:hypothetical protein
MLENPATFRSLLTEGVALSRIKFFIFRFYLFGGPLNHLSQREELKILMDLTFRSKILFCIVELLKAFLHPPPPPEREKLFRIVDSILPKLSILSKEKRDCENCLFCHMLK